MIGSMIFIIAMAIAFTNIAIGFKQTDNIPYWKETVAGFWLLTVIAELILLHST